MTLSGIDHVNVVVRDLAAIAPFYRDVVGLEIDDEFEISEPALSEGLGVPDAVLRVIFWRIPHSTSRIEMVEYAEPAVREGRASRADQAGFGHLAFRVDDIDAAYSDLRGRGAAFVSPPVTVGGGTRFCFFRDPEGNILELIQPARATRRAG